jgi:hypothetical protein
MVENVLWELMDLLNVSVLEFCLVRIVNLQLTLHLLIAVPNLVKTGAPVLPTQVEIISVIVLLNKLLPPLLLNGVVNGARYLLLAIPILVKTKGYAKQKHLISHSAAARQDSLATFVKISTVRLALPPTPSLAARRTP